MPIFEPWDVVRVPFPYTDRPIRQRRPALVIGAGDLAAEHGLLWLIMITSAENRGWPAVLPLADRDTVSSNIRRTLAVAFGGSNHDKH